MAPELLKTFKENWVGISSLVVALAGLLLNIWPLAGTIGASIWQNVFVDLWFLWFAGGLYVGYRLFRFGRNFYLETKDSQQRFLAFQSEVLSRFEAESKSRRDGDESSSKLVDEKQKAISETLRRVFHERAELQRQYSEQRQQVINLEHQVVTLSENLVKLRERLSAPPKQAMGLTNLVDHLNVAVKKKYSATSLLDILPPNAIKPPKETNNGGAGS